MKRTLFVCLLVLLATALPGIAEWTQWRGPGGAGVALDAGPLPESWEPGGARLRWETEIPGEGISSPVASDGVIFLTTAYDSPTLNRLRSFLRIATVVLAALIPIVWFRGRKGAGSLGDGRVARFMIGSVTVLLLIAVLLVTFRPEEFFELGNPGRAFRIAGALLLIGLVAASGWLHRRSPGRLIGTLAVLVATALILIYMPASSRGPTPLEKSLPFIGLQVILALWLLFGAVRARRRGVGEGGSRSLLAALVLLLTAAVYLPINVLNGLDRVVLALDEETGEIVWQRTVFTSPPEKKWPTSTFATPTPAVDGERVYAYFGHGLATLDLDGNVLWRERFPDYAHSTRYGASASPIVDGDTVILGRESEMNIPDQVTWLAAWDKRTGERLWREEIDDLHDSYTTPLLVETEAGKQLLIPSWRRMGAHDPASGERLWSLDYSMQQVVASLAGSGDLVALSAGAHGDRFIYVLRLPSADVRSGVETVWKTNRGVAVISSPVIYDGKLFTVTVPGILTAFDVESGEQLWKKRLNGEHYASLIAGDGKVYAVSTEGRITVISASELDVLATHELDEVVYASPAIAGGCLLIRTVSRLLCIEGGERPAAVEPAPAG